jgi:dephospho-CoA kinase
MLKVGLTGGIGSGKSTVAAIFSSLGVPVFFADAVSRSLSETSPEIIASLKNLFGAEVYDGNLLNRKLVASIVFSDPIKLRKLNSVIHPAVHREFEIWTLKHNDQPYVVEEAALLFESGASAGFDYLVLVTAPLLSRIERVMKRDNATREDVIKRMNSQMPEDEKVPKAHFLLFNEDESMLLPQVLAFHEKMISLSNK